MANRILTPSELATANSLLAEIRARIEASANGDEALAWALRRKIYKELGYDERGKPMERRKLKDAKWKAQRGKCAVCRGDLPEKYTILDRLTAMGGYTPENTRLLCMSCDTRTQQERGYT